MVDNVTFELKGLEELRFNLRKLSADAEFKGAKYAGRKAANIIRDAAIANANAIDDPETSEDIAANIVSRFSSSEFKKSGDTKFRIGVQGGAKIQESNKQNKGGETAHWRFIELGTRTSRAKPFMLPALTENIDSATNEFTSAFGSWLDRQVKKLKKVSA